MECSNISGKHTFCHIHALPNTTLQPTPLRVRKIGLFTRLVSAIIKMPSILGGAAERYSLCGRKSMYQVVARIEEFGTDAVGCFDPTVIIHRLMEEIPEVMVCLHDYAWNDYEAFGRMGAEGAMRMAESDALRRGPVYVFRLVTGTSQEIKGVVERYSVRISSEQEIPAGLKQMFQGFLGTLRFAPIEVKSVRIEGNDEHPA